MSRYIADLQAVIAAYCPGERPALVGESWGAMLALAYAAAYPDRIGPVALVGCGTFDLVSRAQMVDMRRQRQTPAYHQRVAQIKAEVADSAE